MCHPSLQSQATLLSGGTLGTRFLPEDCPAVDTGPPIFSQAPFIADFTSFAVEAPGGDTTVNRGGARFDSPDSLFEDVHGPGLRAIYDLADLDRSRFMIATGQSGNPLSPFYGNMAPRWRDGEYVTFSGKTNDNASLLRLLPK